MPVKSTTNIFAALQRKKKQPVKDSDIVDEAPQNGIDRHDEIEKAIFSSASGFGDWAEEPEAGDWGASVPAEEESEEGWNQAKQGARMPSAIRQALHPEQHSANVEERDDIIVEDVLADIDVEAELGIELARTDDEEESDADDEQEEPPQQGVKQESIEKAKELKKESKLNLSKKEAQEMKKKELEDLDAMLAEFGVETKQANGKEETRQTESSKAAKRRAKKERQAHANGAKSDDGKSQSSSDQQDSLEPAGPAIDPDALKSRKAAAKKKSGKKGGSAAAAAIAEAQAKAKKNAAKDKTKYNEFPTR